MNGIMNSDPSPASDYDDNTAQHEPGRQTQPLNFLYHIVLLVVGFLVILAGAVVLSLIAATATLPVQLFNAVRSLALLILALDVGFFILAAFVEGYRFFVPRLIRDAR